MPEACLCAKWVCVPGAASLAAGGGYRDSLGGVSVVGPSSLGCSGAGMLCCEPPVSWVGSGEADVKSSSALLTARVPAKERSRTFNEGCPHRQIIFCCLLVAKQSLPACKTSLWCIGVEVFDLG